MVRLQWKGYSRIKLSFYRSPETGYDSCLGKRHMSLQAVAPFGFNSVHWATALHREHCGLNVSVSLPNTYVKILTLSVMGLGGGAFGRGLYLKPNRTLWGSWEQAFLCSLFLIFRE